MIKAGINVVNTIHIIITLLNVDNVTYQRMAYMTSNEPNNETV
jgi:hypothetical protein